MSYVRYANLCADYLRAVMKEPFKSKAQARQVIYFRSASVADGKASASNLVDVKNGMPKAASS